MGKRSIKPKRKPAGEGPRGLGATQPAEGAAVRERIEKLLGTSVLDGYGLCAVSLGLTAAKRLVELAESGLKSTERI